MLPMVAISQVIDESKIIKTDQGKFIIHTVEKGQTLYAISKLYSVSVEDITKANPEIEDFGIRIDQTLRIPVGSIDKKEAKKSSIEISGDTIYHEVVKKETLYALSKKYEISVEEIERLNPEVKNGLGIGMIIKIPSIPLKQEKSELEQYQKPISDSLILHEVLPKETLYSLSKKYDVSIDSIQMVNDGLAQGLKVGATIRIPVKNPNFRKNVFPPSGIVLSEIRRDTILGNDTLKIAVFLPFCTEKNKELQETNDSRLYNLSLISLEFYRGFNLALDSLKLLGFRVEVEYFDTENDTNTCKKLMQEIQLNSFNLFVGPLFQTNFKIIANKAKEFQIPIVSPVKISSSLLLDNPFVVKGYSSSPSLVINLANFAGEQFADSNLTIISGSDKNDARFAQIFQKHFNNTTQDSIGINKLWQPSVTNFKRYIQEGKHNYIALISSDEAFVSASMSLLYKMTNEKTQITILGLDSWANFKSITTDYLMNLHVLIPQHNYADYQSPTLISILKNYRSQFYIDPTIHVLSGFDIGMYFVQALSSEEFVWRNYIEQVPYNGLNSRFDFVKISDHSGYENQGGFILEYCDYNLLLKK